MKRLFLVAVLVFSINFSSQLFAADLGFKGIAPKIGIIMPEGSWDTGFIGAVAVDMGEITNNLNLFPLLGYWSSGYDFGTEKVSLSNFQIGADVHYSIEQVKGLYAGGGLSVNFLSWDIPGLSLYYSGGSFSETEFGLNFLGGYMMPVGNLLGFAEAKYNLISDFNTFEITIGVYFDMVK